MSWYTTLGNAREHVIRSETKYIRNFKNTPFTCRMDKLQKDQLLSKLEKLLDANGFKKMLDAKSDLYELFSFAEKGFCDADETMLSQVSPKSTEQFSLPDTSLYFNEPCSLSVAVGGKDMLVIRSLLSGLAIGETQSIALEAEELFDREFEFAYSHEMGYLSPFIQNCGSGEVFSTLLFLPAIKETGDIESVRAMASMQSCSLLPFSRGEENLGGLYLLSHSPSHRCDHVRDMELFCSLVTMIIEKEKLSEGIIFNEKRKIIIEEARRALGTLLFARSIEESELLETWRKIRICLITHGENGILPNVTFLTLNRILAECMSFSVLASHTECASQDELDEKRAQILQKILSETSDKA